MKITKKDLDENNFYKEDSIDTDEEITAKLQSKEREWQALTEETAGYCPLHKNTPGYIQFFGEHGRQVLTPTGILDSNHEVHQRYLEATGQRTTVLQNMAFYGSIAAYVVGLIFYSLGVDPRAPPICPPP